MKKPYLGVALLPYTEFLQSCLPLFRDELIECIEWPFDIIHDQENIPEWAAGLRTEYSNANRLVGHGLYYSILEANWSKRQEEWLEKVAFEVNHFNYSQITEHFGFMSRKNAHQGFPLPLPLTPKQLLIGQDRLKRLYQVAEVPVGIENLALAFSMDDVKEQAEFLSQLVEPINGFIILDIHNLYCQSHNFNIPLDQLILSYPLHLVREIHISGGSWADENGEKIRRDTHDDKVPQEVLDGLKFALPHCKHVEFVIFERLQQSMQKEHEQSEFQADFMAIKSIVDEVGQAPVQFDWGKTIDINQAPLIDLELFEQQNQICAIFKSSTSAQEVKQQLLKIHSSRNWEDKMLATGLALSKKWN